MTFNEFQSACKRAWDQNGCPKDSDAQRAEDCLLKAKKYPDQTKKELISEAWYVNSHYSEKAMYWNE